ncbi:factor of DNA methylation 1-like isoform X2 [Lotus japonicus]|uniref:factor of DNA methylation 1-like isoform X2 n=1 Tax=Lotus japonicus TaxID=34305 RepID=UPI002584CEF6|nr:factor of DNA methylation 1-like isoform X2 [Lotus japonicus]
MLNHSISNEEALRKQRIIVSLQNEIDDKNHKLMEMEHKHSETLAWVRKHIVGLVENINNKERSLLEMECKYNESLNMVHKLMNERDELHDGCQKELHKMSVMNSKMNGDMERLKIENWHLSKQLEDSKALNDRQEKNFIEEIQKSLKDMFRGRSQLGIKRMGELDPKPFQTFCLQKYSCEQWQDISAKLCSSWEENLKDSAWHPFKTIEVNGIPQVVLDENDEKLKGLKNECGEVVYKAVENALMEMEEYNSSGRYAIPEIWNWKEGRKATLKEIIQFIIRQLKIHKRKRKY